ncbi:hypothetical protein OPQ81_001593 [Rhizoctonia solani]|nr:hypothetical protein OPQ81_001593 [Rhizoctonia solani]
MQTLCIYRESNAVIDKNEVFSVTTSPALAPSVIASVVRAITEHVHAPLQWAISWQLQGNIFKLDTQLVELSGFRTPKRDGTAEQLCSTNASTSPYAVLPETSSNNQPQSSSACGIDVSELYGLDSPEANIVSQAVETCEPYPQHPQPVHTASPLLTHDTEGDPWAINQYITLDPRFRDSTLVFPRIHQPSNPSWPFWRRYRVAVMTTLATLIAFGFVLAAIIGSVTMKND